MTTTAFPKGSRGFRLLTPGNPKTEKGRRNHSGRMRVGCPQDLCG
jgi:hypothetical protein